MKSITLMSPSEFPKHHFATVAVTFLDLLAVGLVVPLIAIVFKNVGGKAHQWGALSAIYSVCQIIGGVMMGRLSDKYGRTRALMVSQIGAGISYGLVGFSFTIPMLLVSRVVVGLVKQTGTITKAMAADFTRPTRRAAAFAHLSAATSLGWFAGQYFGGQLASEAGIFKTCTVSAMIFAVIACATFCFLPSKMDEAKAQASMLRGPSKTKGNIEMTGRMGVLCRSKGVLVAVLLKAAVYFVKIGTSSLATYYLADRFNMNVEDLGKLVGVQGIVALALNIIGTPGLVKLIGERSVLLIVTVFFAFLCIIESLDAITVDIYAYFIMPGRALLQVIISPCLDSMFVTAVPTSDRGAALGGLDVILSVVGIVSPVAFGYLYDKMGYSAVLRACTALYIGLTAVNLLTMRSFWETGGIDTKKKKS